MHWRNPGKNPEINAGKYLRRNPGRNLLEGITGGINEQIPERIPNRFPEQKSWGKRCQNP